MDEIMNTPRIARRSSMLRVVHFRGRGGFQSACEEICPASPEQALWIPSSKMSAMAN
jgi:hypothetical protein